MINKYGSKKSVILGMSGGVDSSYSAYLLKEQRYDVTGVYLKMHSFSDETDVAAVAEKLNIPLIVEDCREDFKKYVTENFVEEYSNGRTPNPCVVCNRYVKIARLIAVADNLGIEYIATGHYVKVKQNPNNGRHYICKAADSKKDQSYFLWKLTDSQLSRFIPPLASFEKEYIKADALNKSVMSHPVNESQEICFIPDNDYKAYIEGIRGKYPSGNFISKDGKILGTHNGIIHYTVGQRKKLGISFGVPYSVTDINAKDNTVTIEPYESENIFKRSFVVHSLNFGYVDGDSLNRHKKLYAKIRFAAKLILCEVEFDGYNAIAYLDEPARAITPGQSCVFYIPDRDGDMCVAFGGIIMKAD